MCKTDFVIIGGGWRAEFYLRIAKELPERFEVSGMVIINEVKGKEMAKKWNVKVFSSIENLLKVINPMFAVVSVPREVCAKIIEKLASKKIPVLAETPPAEDLDGLIKLNKLTADGAKIQVAEQYQFQPMIAALISVARSGKLGDISQVQLSVAHCYHGISVMRKIMGIGFENATITARSFSSPLIDGPSRDGKPNEEKTVMSNQVIATFDYGDKLAIYDFTDDQYFSWVRSNRLLIRGYKGEIVNYRVSYQKDFRTPVEFELNRKDAGLNGNLEGYYHKGILAGEEWIYENPFVPARFTDDEIAVATCLNKMACYVNGGPSFYSLAEASQDHYLSLMFIKSLKDNKSVSTQSQPWGI
ncbi:Gfo/Idh/MocA family protein [Clostridium lacusfryxellense]|uniref:Gfo/Idh/MocA family protein n=1 Tax=Clostridium lacusfryxellense TaxID=205328 RepID=UPI001C0D9096|nr:Gfo/Idh/MocA family oxidoreductase [Clostridium lacusfryxellense]MBU3112749.1 Gfo/Idh/MocA family oxidoreductase [Clostridium lacusfryxellense]